jgi:hypothetical protein
LFLRIKDSKLLITRRGVWSGDLNSMGIHDFRLVVLSSVA